MQLKNNRNPSALIMGLGHPRQTAFVRSLSRAGGRVHATYTEQKVHRFSRHLSSFTPLPVDPEAQLEQLITMAPRTGGLLVATNDDYVGLVSRNVETLRQHYIVPLPEWDVVWPMIDRDTAYSKARSIGIDVPQFWLCDTEEELNETVAGLDLQASDHILKTLSVLSAPLDADAQRQSRAAPRERKAFLRECHEVHRITGKYPMIQKVIPGAADSAIGVTMVIAPNKDVILSYCVKRLRLATYKINAGYVHPYELGSVVWCETVHDREAVEATRALVELFGYTGQITVEFRRDSRTNKLYLMKIEPRPVRATSLSSQIGMDIPQALHAVFTGQTPRVASDYPDGVGWLWAQVYVTSLIRNPHHNRRDMVNLIRSFRSLKAFGEDFTDPMPLIAGALKLGGRSLQKLAAAPFAKSQSS